eukprot:TRINITY_DN55600_c0_g1_i1.p1 TRINITY_DN55600_c0_g1~~TRINITY_DN55600_c0_g1_i1.p1  ORF type:complete len:111 (-),score=22.92 TRINITY_DN55600_c0_g1_i1:88-420(-)
MSTRDLHVSSKRPETSSAACSYAESRLHLGTQINTKSPPMKSQVSAGSPRSVVSLGEDYKVSEEAGWEWEEESEEACDGDGYEDGPTEWMEPAWEEVCQPLPGVPMLVSL